MAKQRDYYIEIGTEFAILGGDYLFWGEFFIVDFSFLMLFPLLSFIFVKNETSC